jgi:hypothetical protein
VRQQFDRQVAHYLTSSAMVNRGIIEAIVFRRFSEPTRACSAGALSF